MLFKTLHLCQISLILPYSASFSHRVLVSLHDSVQHNAVFLKATDQLLETCQIRLGATEEFSLPAVQDERQAGNLVGFISITF